VDELLPNEDKIIRKVAPEQFEPLRSREAQVVTWAFGRITSVD
jgi:hypothetical protein